MLLRSDGQAHLATSLSAAGRCGCFGRPAHRSAVDFSSPRGDSFSPSLGAAYIYEICNLWEGLNHTLYAVVNSKAPGLRYLRLAYMIHHDRTLRKRAAPDAHNYCR